MSTTPFQAASEQVPHAGWTFLTNHAHVLLCIARDESSRLRDVAEQVGITERAVRRIVLELATGGYVVKRRLGRRNSYEINPCLALRHSLEHEHTIGQLLDLLLPAVSPETLSESTNLRGPSGASFEELSPPRTNR